MNDEGFTKEELESNHETLKHIKNVRRYLKTCEERLRSRGENHDQTKMEQPEVAIFAEYTPRLAESTYGSEEYEGFLKEMKSALDHHYAKNRHHPEHFRDSINDMTLIDVIEMLCDWKAATLRHHDGNILKSIEHNAKRFSIDSQLVRILQNTAELFEEI
jgi:hypothetical protein